MTIPDGVTEIGNYTFYNCSSLTKVTIPDSVTSIGAGAFYDCNRLTSVTIPDGVTNIGVNAFSGCSGLTNVTIPDSVTNIGGNAFSGCTSLVRMMIPDSVTSIGTNAFYRCSGLKELIVPASWEGTDWVANTGVSSGCEIIYGMPVEMDDEGNCTVIRGGMEWRYRVEEGHATLTSVRGTGECLSVLPEFHVKDVGKTIVTRIAEGAFAEFEHLETLLLSGNLQELAKGAFSGCPELKRILVPAAWEETGTMDGVGLPEGCEVVYAIHSGRIEGMETWETGKAHVVLGQLTVPSGAELTIKSGAVVKFTSGSSLLVEAGGTCTANGVVFTHIADDTIGGDTMGDGNETAPVSDVYKVTGALTTDEATEWRYLTMKTSGQISGNTVWQGNRVIHVTNNVTVAKGKTLTVMPGAVVKFAPGVGLTVNSGGTLNAIGTRAQPIVFTSIKDDEYGGDTNGDGDATVAQPGDWTRITASGTVNMDYCRIRHCNNNSDYGAIHGTGGTVRFDDGVIEYSVYECVRMNSGRFESRNSVFRESSMGFGYYGGSGTYVYNGVVADCTVGCRASNKHFYNTVFYRCLAFTDQGGDNSSFDHCLFYNPAGSGPQSYGKVGSNGNKWGDPLFTGADDGDFRTRAGSACIDAGDGTVASETDYYGRPRMNDPNVADTGVANSSGVCPDIGIYEMEGGNAASDVDLQPVRVTAGAEASVGGPLAVSWSVANAGTEKAGGPWRDVVSLVNEGSGESVALGEVVVSGGLAGKASRECLGSFTVPPVGEGEWRVQVQVNAYRDVWEGALATNNARLSGGTVTVGVPGLGEDGTAVGSASAGAPFAAKVVVPDEGRWMLRLEGPKGATVRYGVGFVPSEGSASGKAVIGNDGTALVSLSAGTTVYVTVEGSGAVNVRLLDAALAVSAVSPTELPGSGTTTLTVKGANFAAGASVAVGGVLAAGVEWLNAETLVATVDCAALPAGVCDVVVEQDGESAVLPNAVTVARTAGKAELKAWLDVPSNVRQGRVVTIYVNYENVGNLDMPAPVLEIVSTGQVFHVDGLAYTNQVKVMGLSAEAPCGTLRPGEPQRLAVLVTVGGASVRWTLRSQHAGQEGAKRTALPLQRFYNPDWVFYPADANQSAFVEQVRGKVGATWAEFYMNLGTWLNENGAEEQGFDTLAQAFADAKYREAVAERKQGATVSGRRTEAFPTGSARSVPDYLEETVQGAVWLLKDGEWVQMLKRDGSDGKYTYTPISGVSIDKTKKTYVIIHGNLNSIDEAWVRTMASGLASHGQVLAVNWAEAAAKLGGIPQRTAVEIPEVAREARRQLVAIGVNPQKTVLIGHSHGGHVAGRIAAEWTGGSFTRLVGLDTSTKDWGVHGETAWLNHIKSHCNQVEFYKSSWNLSLEEKGDLHAHYSFALVEEGGDFYERVVAAELGRHGYACDWFNDTIWNEGNYPHLGFNFMGTNSWKALCGGKTDIPEPGTGGLAGVIRGNQVEMLSPLRAGRIPWRYQETILAGEGEKPMEKLCDAMMRSYEVENGMGAVSQVKSGESIGFAPKDNRDNLSIGTDEDLHETGEGVDAIGERESAAAWLVDLEGVAGGADVSGWTYATLYERVKAAGMSKHVRQVDAVGKRGILQVLRNAFGLGQDTAVTPRFGNAIFGEDRPLVTKLEGGGCKYRRVMLVVGAGVDGSGYGTSLPDPQKAPAWDIYPENNFAFSVVEAVPSDGEAVMAEDGGTVEGPAARRKSTRVVLVNGQTVHVEANSNGVWSVTLDGKDSRVPEDSFVVYQFEADGPIFNGKQFFGEEVARASGTLPDGVDAKRYAVKLQVLWSPDGGDGEGDDAYGDDFTTCVLDVRRMMPEPDSEKEDGKSSSVPQSCDPNEMGGPDGVKMVEGGSTNRYVEAGRWMEYTVYFENKADAAAAAQEVRVVNPLSEWLDWDTFELGEVAFGGQADLSLVGKGSGTSEVALEGNAGGWTLRTVAGGAAGGVAEWYLRVVDPATADGWPEDVYAGFLPPNDATGRGEGRVSYRVKVREDAPIGAVISNSASITFDFNAPIETDPAWWNIVDAVQSVSLDGAGSEGRRGDEGSVEVVAGKPYGDLLPVPEKSGWEFAGWWTGPDGTGEQVTAETVASADTLELFAKWVRAVFGELWLDVTHGSVVVGTNGVTAGFAPDGSAVEGMAERYVLTGTSSVHSVRFAGGSFTNTWTNLVIDLDAKDAVAVALEGASVEVTLEGDNFSASGEDCAGVRVDTGLVLSLQGVGRLEAYGGKCGAGIGGGKLQESGRIEVRAGTVEAYGGEYGAGIGGGLVAPAAGAVVIMGGSVKARGSDGGEDIGGGFGREGTGVPVDASGTEVHEVEVPLATDMLPAEVVVELGDGRTYRYAGSGHEGDSSLWFWLPDGTYEFVADGDDYGAHVAGEGTAAVFTDPGNANFVAPPVGEVSSEGDTMRAAMNPAYRTSPFEVWTATGLKRNAWDWTLIPLGGYDWDATNAVIRIPDGTNKTRVLRLKFLAR